MNPSAQASNEPRRGKSLVFSLMMILSAFSVGIAGLPLTSATGNGEWLTVHMDKAHWESGEDVDATIKAESLSTGDYSIWYNVETLNGTSVSNATLNFTDAGLDGVESFDITISASDLWDDCWNFYANLYDGNGTMLFGTSFTFDVGTGQCQGGPPGGSPYIWWNGNTSWDLSEEVVYHAEIGGLDAVSEYNFVWDATDNLSHAVASGSQLLSGVGNSTVVEAMVGTLTDGCYEIAGHLMDDEDKEIPGSGSMMMFEVGSGICQGTGGPGPSVYAMYDEMNSELMVQAMHLQEGADYTLKVHLMDQDMFELLNSTDTFTANGTMFEMKISIDLTGGDYPMDLKLLDSDGNVIAEQNMDLMVYGGGGDGPTISVWLQDYYESGDEIFVGYHIDNGTGGGQGGGGPTYVCGNGEEIDFSWVNDGDEDCSDGSDEPQDMDSSVDSDGDGNFTNDHDSWFDCNDAAQTTVNMDVVNDGTWDCDNGADEGEAGPPEDEGDGPDLSATLNLYDEMDSTLLSTYDLDMNASSLSLGFPPDGVYKVEVILEERDAAGDTWEVDNDGFHFCLGDDCEGGGPDWMTGNATLDLSVTFGDYDSASCFGGFVMLFDWSEIYMGMMSGPPEDGDDEDDGPQPVWMDWQTVTSPGNYTLMGLPQGDWVVIVSIDCENPDTGEEYGATNIQGPWSLFNTTFVNDSTTTLAVVLEIMEEGGPGDGGEGGPLDEYLTDNVEVSLTLSDDGMGYLSLEVILKVKLSDFMRAGIDEEFGNGDGEVSLAEAEGFKAMMEFLMSFGEEDGPEYVCYDMENNDFEIQYDNEEDCENAGFYWMSTDDEEGGPDECPFDPSAADSPCNNTDCEDHESDACMQAVMEYCMNNPEDAGCDEMQGHEGDDEGELPPFALNGVLLTADDISEESTSWEGLVGAVPVPAMEDSDTASISMVMKYVFMVADDPTVDIRVLSIMDEDDDDEDEEDEPCEDGTLTLYVYDSPTWVVSSVIDAMATVTDNDGEGVHVMEYGECVEPSESITITFTREGDIEEPDNEPPYCEIYYYTDEDDLTDGKEGGNAADNGSEEGDFEVELTEGQLYTLLFYCEDPDGDAITVTVNPSIGDDFNYTGTGSLSGYYEFTIPTGTAALGEMSFDYTWTDGTNSGSGTVLINVLTGGGDGTDDKTESDDASSGSFVPGFTAVLTMTALAGAFLVFSRRREE